MEWTVAIGVDTHKRTHTAVALDRVGVQVASCELEATSAGYAQLLAWASELGEPAFALEGSGSYGAGLAGLLTAPARLRERLDPLKGDKLAERCARLRPRDESERVLVSVLNRLAARARTLTRELAQLESELERIVSTLAPDLLAQCGIGP